MPPARIPHQFGARTRQRALFGLRPVPVKRLGDELVDQRVAEELQAFVVRAAGAAMGQRLPQQARVGEVMAGNVSMRSGRGATPHFLALNLPTTSRLANRVRGLVGHDEVVAGIGGSIFSIPA
jgi:hypothetical protein